MCRFHGSLITHTLILAVALGASSTTGHAQLLKRLTQTAACGMGALAGVKAGEKLAEIESRRLNLSPAEAAKHRKAFQIGVGLALCGGGAALAGTAYSRLSKRGIEAREQEIQKALEDSAPTPRTYADPAVPSLQGVIVAQPAIVQNEHECRIVQDRLGADEALVKYCRGSNGTWSARTI